MQSSVELLHRAAAGLTSRVEASLKEHGLTLDQWRVLRSLSELGAQSMTELHVSTRITGPTLTRVVDRLVDEALVYRNVDGEDRRRVVVHASQRGRALCRRVAPRISETERLGLSALSEREMRTLRRLLERLGPT